MDGAITFIMHTGFAAIHDNSPGLTMIKCFTHLEGVKPLEYEWGR